MNSKVDAFLERSGQWAKEFRALRQLILDCELTEELKWGQPCYTLDGKNVVLMHGFKHYCALLFHKGALLKDPKGILIQQTENVQAARQIRFTSLEEIERQAKTLKAYVREAIAVEKAGLKVPMKKTEDFPVPEELQARFARSAALKKAFQALTPGRQRAYLSFFSQAKQAKTRAARIEKYLPKILAGQGMDD